MSLTQREKRRKSPDESGSKMEISPLSSGPPVKKKTKSSNVTGRLTPFYRNPSPSSCNSNQSLSYLIAVNTMSSQAANTQMPAALTYETQLQEIEKQLKEKNEEIARHEKVAIRHVSHPPKNRQFVADRLNSLGKAKAEAEALVAAMEELRSEHATARKRRASSNDDSSTGSELTPVPSDAEQPSQTVVQDGRGRRLRQRMSSMAPVSLGSKPDILEMAGPEVHNKPEDPEKQSETASSGKPTTAEGAEESGEKTEKEEGEETEKDGVKEHEQDGVKEHKQDGKERVQVSPKRLAPASTRKSPKKKSGGGKAKQSAAEAASVKVKAKAKVKATASKKTNTTTGGNKEKKKADDVEEGNTSDNVDEGETDSDSDYEYDPEERKLEIRTVACVRKYLATGGKKLSERLNDRQRTHVRSYALHCPEATISCYPLARDALVTRRGLLKCVYHYQVDKGANAKKRDSPQMDSELTGVPYPATKATTLHTKEGKAEGGAYNRVNLRKNKKGEEICDCGCLLDDAIWGLYLWKTGRIAYNGQSHGYEKQGRPPTPAQRNFEITRLKSFGIELDDLWTHKLILGKWMRRSPEKLLQLRVQRLAKCSSLMLDLMLNGTMSPSAGPSTSMMKEQLDVLISLDDSIPKSEA
ncbi:hypothetical protein V5O48_017059 [Marasmius crinis-equi]|uniref:Uncharacterized protein n=1 Tax=Marasmius crinis-equi TaxID=585013 RepID=A0ABR3EQ85_9AGAR